MRRVSSSVCLALACAAVTLSACIDLAPHYQRPALPTPGAFPVGGAYPAAF